MRTVGDIMTRKVIVLTEEENLSGLEEGMDGFELRHLPVVDDGKLVGLISHRDLLRASVSSLDRSVAGKNASFLEAAFVGEIMTRNVRTVKEDTPIIEAARDILSGRFGCLPVIDEDGVVVGIVTENDFLELVVELLKEEETSVTVEVKSFESDGVGSAL